MLFNIKKTKDKEKEKEIKKENCETMHKNIIKYKLLATSAATYSRY